MAKRSNIYSREFAEKVFSSDKYDEWEGKTSSGGPYTFRGYDTGDASFDFKRNIDVVGQKGKKGSTPDYGIGGSGRKEAKKEKKKEKKESPANKLIEALKKKRPGPNKKATVKKAPVAETDKSGILNRKPLNTAKHTQHLSLIHI